MNPQRNAAEVDAELAVRNAKQALAAAELKLARIRVAGLQPGQARVVGGKVYARTTDPNIEVTPFELVTE